MTTSASHTDVSSRGIPDVVTHLRATFRSGRTKPIAWRLEQLEALERMLAEREKEFCAALTEDLGRGATEGWLADLAPVDGESRFARKKLKSWAKPTRVGVPLSVMPAKAWYQYEPLGVVLIIGPWNYPIHLVLAPLVAAIAAGNCAVIKPSEHTPAVSKALARIVPEYLDPEAVSVVEGAADATQLLIDQAFDHCFFTGGTEIGKLVMAACAKHLTPVTLELGGKSPTIIARSADIKVAARRVAWAKLLNSGQTCVAPDYVLIDRAVRDEFVAELRHAAEQFQGGAKHDAMLPLVSQRHAERIGGLLADGGGTTVVGGRSDASGKRVEFAVVVDPASDSDLMRQEIFGPVLPVISVDSLDDAIAHVQQGPKPLAVYLFSKDRSDERRVLDEISNGGTVINHLVWHLLVPQLPFGGVGDSGTGAYHGKWGFEAFSHRKAVLRKPTRPDPSIAYPPYNKIKEKIMRTIL